MPSHRSRVVYAPEALRDLEDITRYTIRQWGIGQARRYRRTLQSEIRKLSQFPLLGQKIPQLGPNSRRLLIQEHIALYDVYDDYLLVTRVVHASSDWLQESSD